jgi:GLPGLI family protein
LESDANFDKSYKMAKILSQADNSYYTDKKTNKRIISKNAYGKDVKIKSFLDSNKWILSNNTKKIGQYLCYEATTIVEVKNNKGIFKEIVTAWYTQDIPYNFGPKGYGSLPGLILELSEGSFKYYASKIKLNTEINLKKPSEINLINQEELDSIGSNKIKNN